MLFYGIPKKYEYISIKETYSQEHIPVLYVFFEESLKV